MGGNSFSIGTGGTIIPPIRLVNYLFSFHSKSIPSFKPVWEEGRFLPTSQSQAGSNFQ